MAARDLSIDSMSELAENGLVRQAMRPDTSAAVRFATVSTNFHIVPLYGVIGQKLQQRT